MPITSPSVAPMINMGASVPPEVSEARAICQENNFPIIKIKAVPRRKRLLTASAIAQYPTDSDPGTTKPISENPNAPKIGLVKSGTFNLRKPRSKANSPLLMQTANIPAMRPVMRKIGS